MFKPAHLINAARVWRPVFRQTRQTGQAGFTLIEILIVMIIIAFLASLSASSFQSSQKKARDARRKSDLHQITTALEAYYNDVKSYPLSSGDNLIMGCNGGNQCDWGDEFVDDKGTSYMVKLPADPSTSRGFKYVYVSTGTEYQLFARLENTEDQGVPKDNDGLPQVYGTLDCGNGGCNYGISSSNTTPEEGHTLDTE
jgi:type II secretion system protein G